MSKKTASAPCGTITVLAGVNGAGKSSVAGAYIRAAGGEAMAAVCSVTDEAGVLSGFISRTDILRAVAADPPLDLWSGPAMAL